MEWNCMFGLSRPECTLQFNCISLIGWFLLDWSYKCSNGKTAEFVMERIYRIISTTVEFVAGITIITMYVTIFNKIFTAIFPKPKNTE